MFEHQRCFSDLLKTISCAGVKTLFLVRTTPSVSLKLLSPTRRLRSSFLPSGVTGAKRSRSVARCSTPWPPFLAPHSVPAALYC